MWHDLGKYNPEFQRKLNGEKVSVEHAGVGAVLANEFHNDSGLPLSFIIAGHHAGLANCVNSEGTGTASLKERLKITNSFWKNCAHLFPATF